MGNNKKKILISLFLIFTLLFLGSISLARAEEITEQGIFLSGVSEKCYKLGNCDFYDISGMIVNIAKVILKVTGTAALVMFILGGLLWLTSSGKQQQVAKGKKILTNALIGLFIVFFAWSIIALLGNVLGISQGYRIENINISATIPNDCGKEASKITNYQDYSCMSESLGKDCKAGHCGPGTDVCCIKK